MKLTKRATNVLKWLEIDIPDTLWAELRKNPLLLHQAKNCGPFTRFELLKWLFTSILVEDSLSGHKGRSLVDGVGKHGRILKFGGQENVR